MRNSSDKYLSHYLHSDLGCLTHYSQEGLPDPLATLKRDLLSHNILFLVIILGLLPSYRGGCKTETVTLSVIERKVGESSSEGGIVITTACPVWVGPINTPLCGC